MDKKEYLKERRLIMQTINLLINKIGAVYLIVVLAVSVIHFVISCIPSENSGEGVLYVPMFVVFAAVTAVPFVLSGTSTFGGKPVSAETLGIKGAQTQLGAFLCMPVRKESVYRFQFEAVILSIISVSLMFAGGAIQNIYGGKGYFIPNIVSVIAAYICVTLLFILVYAPVFITVKNSKFMNAVYVVSVVLMAVYFVVQTVFSTIITFKDFPAFFASGGVAGNVVIIAIAVFYPIAIFAVYKNIILKKKGAGWYE